MTLTFSVSKALLRAFFAGIAWSLGSAAAAQDLQADSFDKASVTAIEFRLTDDNLDQVELDASQAMMQERIVKNLAGWNFPLQPGSGKDYSHRLVAVIGQVAHQSTPVGFSFSAGNSDPRAPEFQKADVISVRCTLASIAKPQETIEQSMEFDARPMVEENEERRSKTEAMELVIDHVSTVCFNLLDELELEKLNPPSVPGIAKPGWMPEIRIETLNPPAIENKSGSGVSPAEASQSVDASKPVDAPQSVETVKPTGDGRKQIIIHNKGTPVIIKFGHDRL